MNEWNEGYFTDSTYTYGYYKELSPALQRFILLMKGFDISDASDEDNHCELGFGQGVSANVHAAATVGNFFGTDFNPSHAAHANKLCQASESGAKFFDDSFEEFLNRDDLPQFDSISLHGIWSWISRENQNHIVEFAKKFLKPNGILYNSYNCYPGWSPAAPLRELFVLHDKYAQRSNKTFERVEEALKFTEELLSKNPAYFTRVPDVKITFENTKKYNHDYLAHEYFNRDWICMYFNEVAEMFQAAKLDFACTTELLEQRDNLMMAKETQEFLNTIESPIMREQVKDYFFNRQFRKDLYIRGSRMLSSFEKFERLFKINFILTSTKPLSEKIQAGMGELTVKNNICEKISEYLAAENYRPKNFNDFLKQNPEITPPEIEEMLLIYTHSGAIAPCQTDAEIKKVEKNCRNLNKYICERAKESDEISALASPVIGCGINFSSFDRLFISAILDGKNSADEMANYAWETISTHGKRLVSSNAELETAEENIAEFKKMIKNFVDERLPIIKILQIV